MNVAKLEPEPFGYWPIALLPNHHNLRSGLAVPTDGPCAFGSARPNGRRCAGVTMRWPEGAVVVSPTTGDSVGLTPWTEDASAIIIASAPRGYGAPRRYFLLDCFPRELNDRLRASWARRRVPQGGGTVLAREAEQGPRRSLYISAFETPSGVPESDFLSTLRRGDLRWYDAPHHFLRDPTPWLQAAAARELAILTGQDKR